MIKVIIFCLVAYCCVVSTTVKCPNGFLWSEGGCRKIWRGPLKIDPDRLIAEPRRMQEMQDMLPIPDLALEGKLKSNIIKRAADSKSKLVKGSKDRHIISVPTQCPSGYKPDANGNCRKVFDFN